MFVFILLFIRSEWQHNGYAIVLLGKYLCPIGLHDPKSKYNNRHNNRFLRNLYRWWLQCGYPTWCSHFIGHSIGICQQNLRILTISLFSFRRCSIYWKWLFMCLLLLFEQRWTRTVLTRLNCNSINIYIVSSIPSAVHLSSSMIYHGIIDWQYWHSQCVLIYI